MSKNATAYLEYLRKELQDVSVVPYPREMVDKVFRGTYVGTLLASRTDHDPAVGFRYPELIFRELVGTLSKPMQERVAHELAFGEMLVSEANAGLRRAGSGYDGAVIVINRGLTSLFYHLTKLLLTRVETFDRPGELGPQLAPTMSFEETIALVRKLLAQYHVERKTDLALGTVVISDERVNLLAGLQHASISFVVAHELAHFILDHLDREHTIEDEFEADECGFALILNWLYGVRSDVQVLHGVAGTWLSLHYLEMIEKNKTVVRHSHPAASVRYERLNELYRIPEAYRGLATPICTMAKHLCDAL